jgi:hypothetical protein
LFSIDRIGSVIGIISGLDSTSRVGAVEPGFLLENAPFARNNVGKYSHGKNERRGKKIGKVAARGKCAQFEPLPQISPDKAEVEARREERVNPRLRMLFY